jgi:aryl-alcohol dehydrogenase-like predicted oxidoreductase
MIDAQPRSTAASVRTECEASLRRLGVDQLDLLQVHWPPTDGTAVEEYWQGLVDLRREGKIRFAGLSNHDLGQLERAEAVGHVDCLQPPLSLIDRDAADVVDWCARNGTGVIAYSPLCSGLLTGRYTVERVAALPATDWRRSEPAFTAGLAANLEFAAILAELAEEWGSTPAAVALGWVLAFDGVSGAIVGAREPEAVDGWAGQPAFRLTDEHLDVLAAALTRTGAGHGPTRPTTTRTTITPTTVTPTTVTRTTEDAAPWD